MYSLKQNGGSDPDEYFINFKNQLSRIDKVFDDDDWWERLSLKLQFEYGNDDPGERSLLFTLLSLLIWGIVNQIELNDRSETSASVSFRGLIEQVNYRTIGIKYKNINDGISTGVYFDKKMFIIFCELLIENIKKLKEYRKITEFIVERNAQGNPILSEDNFTQAQFMGNMERWEKLNDNSWREVNPKKREEIIAAASSKSKYYPNYIAKDYANKVGPTILVDRDRLPSYLTGDIDPTGPEEIIINLYRSSSYGTVLDLDYALSKRNRLREAILYLESFNEQIKIEMWGPLNNPSELSYDKIKEIVLYDIEADYKDIFKSPRLTGRIIAIISETISPLPLSNGPTNASNDTPANKRIERRMPEKSRMEAENKMWGAVDRYNVYTQKIVETVDYITKSEDLLISEIRNFKIMMNRDFPDSFYNSQYTEIDDIIRVIITSTCYVKYLLIKKYELLTQYSTIIDDELINRGEDFHRLTNQTSKNLEIFWNSYFLDSICGTSEYKMTETIPNPPTDTSETPGTWDDDYDSDDSDAMSGMSSEGGAKKLVELKEIKIPIYPYLIKKIFARIEILKESLEPSPINPPIIPQYFLYGESNKVPNPGILSHRGGIGGIEFEDTKYTLLVEQEIKQAETFRMIYASNKKEKELIESARTSFHVELAEREKEKKTDLINKLFGNRTWTEGFLDIDILNTSESILASCDLMDMNEFEVIFKELYISLVNIPTEITRIIYGDYETVSDLMEEGSSEKYVFPKGGITNYLQSSDRYSSMDEGEYSMVWPERHEYLKNINKTEKTYDDYLFDPDFSPEEIFNPEIEKIPGIIYDERIREEKQLEIMMKLIQIMLNKSKNLSTELKPYTIDSLKKPLKKSPTRLKRYMPTIGEAVGSNKQTWKINKLRENDYDFYVADGFYDDFSDILEITKNSKYILSLPKTEGEDILDEILDIEGDDADSLQDKAYAEILKRSIRDFEYNDEELMNEFFIKINELEQMFNYGNPDSLQRKINIVYTNGNGNPIKNRDGYFIKSDVLDYMIVKDEFTSGVVNSETASIKLLPFYVGENEDGEKLFTMEPFATPSNVPKYNIDYLENDAISLVGAPSRIRETARELRGVSEPDYSSELGYDPRSVETNVVQNRIDLDKNPNETYTEYYNRIGYRYRGGAKKKKTYRKKRIKSSKKLINQIRKKNKTAKKNRNKNRNKNKNKNKNKN